MSNNFFSKLKKSLSFLSKQMNSEKELNIVEKKDSINHDEINNQNIDSLLEHKEESNIIKFSYDDQKNQILKKLFEDNKDYIYCCILDISNNCVIASDSRIEIDNYVIIDWITNLLSIVSNEYINSIITSYNSEDFINKVFIVNEDKCNYLNIDQNKLIILVTNQKNQLLTWKFIEKIKESIFV